MEISRLLSFPEIQPLISEIWACRQVFINSMPPIEYGDTALNHHQLTDCGRESTNSSASLHEHILAFYDLPPGNGPYH